LEIKLIRDVEHNGVVHEKGRVFTITPPFDIVKKDTVHICSGHGTHMDLKLGEDCVIVKQ